MDISIFQTQLREADVSDASLAVVLQGWLESARLHSVSATDLMGLCAASLRTFFAPIGGEPTAFQDHSGQEQLTEAIESILPQSTWPKPGCFHVLHGDDVLELLVLPVEHESQRGYFVAVATLNMLRYAVADWAEFGPMPIIVVEQVCSPDDAPRLLVANGAARALFRLDHTEHQLHGWPSSLAKMFGPVSFETSHRGRLSNPLIDLPTESGATSMQMVTKSVEGGLISIAFIDVTASIEAMRYVMSQHEALVKSNADFEEKALEMQALAFSLESAQEVLNAEIQRRRQLEKELRRLIEIDPLSGASTRYYFLDNLYEELRRAARYRHPAALIMVDLDRFKSINDTFGHAAGDMVIAAAVHVCRENLRSGVDSIGRLGGEEFAIFLPETDVQGAFDAAERIRQKMMDCVVSFEDHSLRFTASFGVTVWHGEREEETTATKLLREADKALYEAKYAGRNRVVLAST